jgi:hypothetical protein
MDLSTIRKKLSDEEYQTIQQFRDDMYLMFNNCMTYNPPTSYVYTQGAELLNFFRRALKQAKRQFNGDSSDKLSSTSRSAAVPEVGDREQRREIHGVDIPVAIARPPAPSVSDHQYPAPADAPFTLYHISGAPESLQVTQERFHAVCDLIRNSAEIRMGLNLLKDRFPRFVLDDAVCRLGEIHPSFALDRSEVDAALASVEDHPGALAVGVACAPSDGLDLLWQTCPELPLQSMRPIDDTPDTFREQNLRLMLFYANFLKYWKGSEMTAAKKRIMDTIRQNITMVTLGLAPKQLVKRHELAVLRHINTK